MEVELQKEVGAWKYGAAPTRPHYRPLLLQWIVEFVHLLVRMLLLQWIGMKQVRPRCCCRFCSSSTGAGCCFAERRSCCRSRWGSKSNNNNRKSKKYIISCTSNTADTKTTAQDRRSSNNSNDSRRDRSASNSCRSHSSRSDSSRSDSSPSNSGRSNSSRSNSDAKIGGSQAETALTAGRTAAEECGKYVTRNVCRGECVAEHGCCCCCCRSRQLEGGLKYLNFYVLMPPHAKQRESSKCTEGRRTCVAAAIEAVTSWWRQAKRERAETALEQPQRNDRWEQQQQAQQQQRQQRRDGRYPHNRQQQQQQEPLVAAAPLVLLHGFGMGLLPYVLHVLLLVRTERRRQPQQQRPIVLVELGGWDSTGRECTCNKQQQSYVCSSKNNSKLSSAVTRGNTSHGTNSTRSSCRNSSRSNRSSSRASRTQR
ncbi:unnamed protein product [Rangifer tarandus platyrhynchus]|uniref:Uncharacterized protein n=1 Tax=Rangifer tarandus platyrhynchus TaxID=3082113 RepID=A0ABN8XI43_RANTA|nr:unnamed protein product [Rangifer tarandus platyrhynchus]